MADADGAVVGSEVPRPWVEHYPKGVTWEQAFEAKPVFALLEDSAARIPNRNYIDFFGRTFTYSEVSELVDRAARGFQSLGVKPGVHVGLFLPNCPQYVIAFYGIMKAGGTVVNFSPLYSVPELVHQVEDAEVDIMVTLDVVQLYDKIIEVMDKSRLRQLVVGTLKDVLPFPKNVLYSAFRRRERSKVRYNAAHLRFEELLNNRGIIRPVAISPHEDVAVIQYTGGTTGTPKGAMLTHANLYINALQCAAYDPESSFGKDKMLGALPLFHVFAMTVVLNVSTRMGAEIVLLPKFELEQAMRAISQQQITLVPGVPTMYNAILHHPRLGKYDLSSIRLSISGGAPLPVELKKQFEDLTGASLREGYGLTETSAVVAANPYYEASRAGSVGLPLPGTSILITDPDHPEKILPLGETGEICVVGPQVMKGYWKRPDATEQTICQGRLRTGDIGYMDADGYTYIVDRAKDLILVGGFNVYPRRLEEAIYENEAVKETTVIGIPDDYLGEVPKAFVVTKDGATLDEAMLRAHLKPRLGKVEMPREIEFRKELPKTMIGKLSKKELVAEERAKFEAAKKTRDVA